MRNERAKLSRHNHVAKAMDYILKRWDAFSRSSRTDESAFQTTPPKGDPWFGFRRKSWLFVGSDRGGERAR